MVILLRKCTYPYRDLDRLQEPRILHDSQETQLCLGWKLWDSAGTAWGATSEWTSPGLGCGWLWLLLTGHSCQDRRRWTLFIFIFSLSFFFFFFFYFLFSIFRTTQVRGYQSCCYIGHNLMA